MLVSIFLFHLEQQVFHVEQLEDRHMKFIISGHREMLVTSTMEIQRPQITEGIIADFKEKFHYELSL